MTLSEYYHVFPILANKREIREKAKALKIPKFCCGKKMDPDEINHITFGDYIDLSGCETDAKLIETAERIFGLSGLMKEKAETAIGFLNWVTFGVNGITRLFGKARLAPTPEERSAGVDKLQFGVFGLVDWYAKRMKISHDAVEREKWIIIYKCLDMDVQTARFERKLQKVYANKARKKR